MCCLPGKTLLKVKRKEQSAIENIIVKKSIFLLYYYFWGWKGGGAVRIWVPILVYSMKILLAVSWEHIHLVHLVCFSYLVCFSRIPLKLGFHHLRKSFLGEEKSVQGIIISLIKCYQFLYSKFHNACLQGYLFCQKLNKDTPL